MADVNPFAAFLADLVQDPDKIEEFQENPGQVMTDAGLGAAEGLVMGTNKIDVMLDYARLCGPRPGGSEGATGSGTGGGGTGGG